MNKLNICLISLGFPPDKEGGEAKFFGGIYNYLKKTHNVKVLTGKWNVRINDPNITQFSLFKKRFLWGSHFSLKVINYLKTHNFDIIHGNGPKGSLPIIFSRYRKFITTIHDLGPFETRFSLLPIEKSLIKYVVKKATYITTCSEFIRKEIKHYIPQANLGKIFNLYSAIEEKYKPYPKKAEELRDKLGIEGPIILYIGRIAAYKGVEDIIKAYKIAKKEIPNLNFIIGGNPDFAMKKKYDEWRQKYKDIYFVGFIPSNEIAYYYTLADIFVTYSYASEGFGLTPIEAIACGTPVICSTMLAYKEVLQNNALFVPPKNPKLLAKKIIELLKNHEYRSQLIENAQKFIKRYTWEEVGKKLESVYYKFLEEIK